MTTTWTVIVCGGTLVFAVVGLILLGLKRRSEEQEFALDGAQDFDDEPEPWLPPPPPLEMFPPELQAIIVRDSAKLRAEAEATPEPTNCGQFASYSGPCGGCNVCTEGQRAYYEMLQRQDELAKLRDSLGVHDDGKPVESMRPLDVWPQPDGDPNREVVQVDDRGTPLQPQPPATDEEYFSRPLNIWPTSRGNFGQARPPRQRDGAE